MEGVSMRLLPKIALWLDFQLRIFDWWLNRTHGGRMTCLRNFRGNAPLALTTFGLLLPVLVLGPSWSASSIYSLLTLVAILVATLLWARFVPPGNGSLRPLTWQCIVVVAIAGLLHSSIWPTAVSARVADGHMYAHWFVFVAMVLMLTARLVAPRLADCLLRDLRARFQRAPSFYSLLARADLFQIPRIPVFPLRGLLQGFVTTAWFESIAVAWVPAIFIVLNCRPWVTWVALTAWYLLLVLASLDPRLDIVLTWIKRLFFRGGALLVSGTIITLAAARLWGEQHVTTILEGDSSLVARLILSAYALFWIYEYWINHILCEHLLALTSRKHETTRTRVAYCTKCDQVHTRVDSRRRRIQLHAGTRFVTVGVPPYGGFDVKVDEPEWPKILFRLWIPSVAKNDRWQFYERMDLFQKIVEKAKECYQRDPSPDHKVDDARFDLEDLRRADWAYFALLNIILVIALGIGCVIYSYCVRIKAAVETQTMGSGNRDLRQLLFDPPADLKADGCAFPVKCHTPGGETSSPGEDKVQARRKVIVLCASGGGSRAALYTSSVLNGLHRLGVDDDVLLISSVSGGSAALAYFAAHRSSLVDDASETEWQRFHEAMARNYIHDVMAGSLESRVVGGTSLTQLLSESFERQYAPKAPRGTRRGRVRDCSTVGECPIGVILNATLAGVFPMDTTDETATAWEQRFEATRAWAYDAGSRLLFTNLIGAEPFPKGRAESEHEFLKFELVRDESVSLSAAAAVSSNFPPVFPNAAVDVVNQNTRYWATDGGATENRGVLSLLYFLLDAQRQELARRKASPNDLYRELPEIHVIVAEASALTLDYTNDQGVNAGLSAAGKVASQLMNALMADVESLSAELESVQKHPDALQEKTGGRATKLVHFHYLALPTVFRSHGGVGTHWMLPPNVPLQPVDVFSSKQPDGLELSAEAVQRLLIDLHNQKGEPELDHYQESERARVRQVWCWIQADKLSNHNCAWATLQKTVRGE
jgi:hypothetical protein